jgi:bacteriorhodopsin
LATSAAGSCCILVLGLVVPFTVGVDTTEQNTRVYSILIAYFTAVWIIFAMPWFLTEQYRPGQRLPKGSSYLTIGPK